MKWVLLSAIKAIIKQGKIHETEKQQQFFLEEMPLHREIMEAT